MKIEAVSRQTPRGITVSLDIMRCLPTPVQNNRLLVFVSRISSHNRHNLSVGKTQPPHLRRSFLRIFRDA